VDAHGGAPLLVKVCWGPKGAAAAHHIVIHYSLHWLWRYETPLKGWFQADVQSQVCPQLFRYIEDTTSLSVLVEAGRMDGVVQREIPHVPLLSVATQVLGRWRPSS
jgi:hypothetical protein